MLLEFVSTYPITPDEFLLISIAALASLWRIAIACDRWLRRRIQPESCHRDRDPVQCHFSNANIRFQSFFMLMTFQLRFFDSVMSSSENVPIFDFAP